MSEGYYAGACWLYRSEPVEACASRAESCFQLLSSCDPALTRWFEQADSRDASLQLPVEPVAARLLALFSKEENQGVKGGISFGAWNGAQGEDSTGIRFHCGSAARRVPDSCVLTPPSEGTLAERMLTAPVMSRVLRSMALAWEPEWGIATSEVHRDEVLKTATPGTFVGWVMYFSRRRGPVPPLPDPVRVEPVAGLGTLVILTPERFTASNPQHLALASHVHTVLDGAGLLHPLRPWDP